MVTVLAKRSAAEVKIEVRAIRKAGDKINKSPNSARQFLLKHGFITKGNKLSRQYR